MPASRCWPPSASTSSGACTPTRRSETRSTRRSYDAGIARVVVICVGLLAASWCAPATAQAPGAPLGPVVVLAHRGASYDAPEHTRFAYDLAIAYDTDFLECDLQLTKDDVLVCVHDVDVARTTGGRHTGRVDSYTLAQLREMDFGSWFNTANPTRARPEFAGARVVTFEEQLDCYRAANPRMRFHVETKAPAEYRGRMEPLLVEVLRRKGLIGGGSPDAQRSPVIVQSFEIDSLRALRRLEPSIPTAWLWTVPPPEAVTGDLPPEVDVAAPVYQHLLADPTYVARAHAAGHEVHTWTVDDAAVMDLLLDLGVDGIFTNRADVLRERVDARGVGVPASVRGNPASVPPTCGAPPPTGAPASAAVLPETGRPSRLPAAAVASLLVAAVVLGLRRVVASPPS